MCAIRSLETLLSRRRSLARNLRRFKYSWQCLNPLSSSGVDLFLIGTALMKLLSVANITKRYLWSRREVVGYRPGRLVAMRFWNSLSNVVLIISMATCRVRLTDVRDAGGSVLASLGGGVEEQVRFCSICMCPFVVRTNFCRSRAALGSVRWSHPRK